MSHFCIPGISPTLYVYVWWAWAGLGGDRAVVFAMECFK